MKVWVKNFAVSMDIKNTGIELEVSDNADQHLGDLILTKTKLIWCKGRTRRENGKTITWEDFAALMNAR